MKYLLTIKLEPTDGSLYSHIVAPGLDDEDFDDWTDKLTSCLITNGFAETCELTWAEEVK